MPEEQTIDELHEEIQRLREQVEQKNGHSRDENHSEKRGEKKDEKKDDEQKQEEPQRPKQPLKQRARAFVRRHPVGLAVGAVLLVAIVIGAIFLLQYLHSYESTDDAFVEGHLNQITPRI